MGSNKLTPALRSATMRQKLTLMVIALVALGLAGIVNAGSLEGVWKLESGRWPGNGEDVVYPGDGDSDKGAQAYRVFSGQHHFFISSFPTEEIFNANMTRYSVEGNVLHMEKVIVKNAGHLPEWDWTFTLDGDRLTLEMSGMQEVWTRVE
jgi:hypothetical protein